MDLRCQTSNGHEWRIEIIDSAPDGFGRQRRIRVIELVGEGRDVPLCLDLLSCVLYGWLGTWPPERALKMNAEGDAIVVRYEDEWVPFERPILPFGYDCESEWKVRFDPKKRTWKLSRLRRLNRK